MNEALSVSNNLIDMLKFYEGLHDKRSDGRIEAYLDTNTKPAKWTIGWGHTATARPGLVVTEAQAVALKKIDLKEHEDSVKSAITVPLTQGQFDALVSFSYNLGANKFKKTTVVKAVNSKNIEKAKIELQKYNRAGGRVLAGLIKRRQSEVALMDMKKPEAPAGQPLAFNNSQLQQSMNNPNSLWVRMRSLVGA
jgi:lysozyme